MLTTLLITEMRCGELSPAKSGGGRDGQHSKCGHKTNLIVEVNKVIVVNFHK
jgi:hypothetical protein